MGFTVIPLNLGTLSRDKSAFTYLKDPGTKIDIPIIAYLVKGQGKTIMVDTGPDEPEVTRQKHLPFTKTEDQRLPNILKKENVDCLAVDIVFLTHLHWDHSYYTELFPNAKIIVQEIELNYARNPLPIHSHTYDEATFKDKKFTVIRGDVKIAEGMTAILTPGHSPGSHSLLLESGTRKALIASDTLPLYENWNSPTPIANGSHYNLSDYFATFEKIKNLNVDLIFPGHDPKVFEKTEYEF